MYKEQPMRAVRETDLAYKMLGRFVVASAAILPSRLLLLVKLPFFVSSRPRTKIIKKSPMKGGFFNGADREKSGFKSLKLLDFLVIFFRIFTVFLVLTYIRHRRAKKRRKSIRTQNFSAATISRNRLKLTKIFQRHLS